MVMNLPFDVRPGKCYKFKAYFTSGLTFHMRYLDSSVGTATRYGLDDPGIDSRWWRNFPHPSTPALVPTQAPIQLVPGFFPGCKAAGAWR